MTIREAMDKEKPPVLCHCGKPLHYNSSEVQALIERQITRLGDSITVHFYGRIWRVQRHYIALHGLRAEDLPTLGFPEITR